MKKIVLFLVALMTLVTAFPAQAADDEVWHCADTGCYIGLPRGAVRIFSSKGNNNLMMYVWHKCWDTWDGTKRYDGRIRFQTISDAAEDVQHVDIDYIYLWRKNNDGSYSLQEAIVPGILDVPNDGYVVVDTGDDRQNFGEHNQWHTEVRYRIQWPPGAGGWSTWRHYNSDGVDHACD